MPRIAGRPVMLAVLLVLSAGISLPPASGPMLAGPSEALAAPGAQSSPCNLNPSPQVPTSQQVQQIQQQNPQLQNQISQQQSSGKKPNKSTACRLANNYNRLAAYFRASASNYTQSANTLRGQAQGAFFNFMAGGPAEAARLSREADNAQRQADQYNQYAGADQSNAQSFQRLANDPPDSNFTVVAPAIVPPAPQMEPDSGTTPAQAAAFNALMINNAQEIALLVALLHALERADGAAAAGNATFVAQQQQAAGQFAAQLVVVLAEQPALLRAVAETAVTAGAPVGAILPQQVSLSQSLGPSPVELATWLALGASPTDVAAMRSQMNTADPAAVAALGLNPFFLTNAEVIGSIQDEAASMSAFAVSVGAPAQLQPTLLLRTVPAALTPLPPLPAPPPPPLLPPPPLPPPPLPPGDSSLWNGLPGATQSDTSAPAQSSGPSDTAPAQ